MLRTMAAYIDLNCVRAGLVVDPVDYRFCGYAEAVAGSEAAQAGIRSIMGKADWAGAQAQYRETLFGTGATPREYAAEIPPEELKRVISTGGKLPLAQVLRCRIRYFTDGAVLGSKAYVATQLAQHPGNSSRLPLTKPRALPAATDWGELAVLRLLRGPVFS